LHVIVVLAHLLVATERFGGGSAPPLEVPQPLRRTVSTLVQEYS